MNKKIVFSVLVIAMFVFGMIAMFTSKLDKDYGNGETQTFCLETGEDGPCELNPEKFIISQEVKNNIENLVEGNVK